MARWRFAGRRVVITGAASGLGAGFAREMGRRGAALWLVDINAEGLKAEAAQLRAEGVAVHTATVDVTDADAMADLAVDVHAEGGPPDVLVNNAGVVAAGPILDLDLDAWRWMFDINVHGVAHGCRVFGPAMAAAPGRAQIVNVASAAAFGGLPQGGGYCATKAAVLALSEALAAENDPRRLGVTVVCPGFTGTGLADASRYAGDGSEKLEGLVGRLFALPGRTPAVVARRVADAVERGEFLVPIFAEAWTSLAMRHVPARLLNPVRRALGGRLKQGPSLDDD
ncbi:MAG: SDR family NAD(P)-dependent oxidoreductase [bacterium]